jgi:8-oxo-dGTP diphosphatase
MEFPKVGVAAVIVRDNHLLLIRRKGAHGAGTWAVPGGHLEFGEDPAQCAIREVLEETGLVVSGPRCIALTNDVFPAEEKHYITIWMKVECPSEFQVTPCNDEVAEWGWFIWNALPSPLFLPLENLVIGRRVVFGGFSEIIGLSGV